MKHPSALTGRTMVPVPDAVHHQRGLQSCAAMAFCDMAAVSLYAAGRYKTVPGFSPLFLYYNARRYSGNVGLNRPVDFIDLCRAATTYGMCEESAWPYELSRFMRMPTPAAYAAARDFPGITVERINPSHAAIVNRMDNGFPVFAGIRLFMANARSFHKGAIARSGVMPDVRITGAPVGNHALLLVGYDVRTGRYIARNSLGEAWGMKGYVEIERGYVIDGAKTFLLASVSQVVTKNEPGTER